MAKYCSNCGKELKEGADVCLHCGMFTRKETIFVSGAMKSKLIAGLLGILLGVFGAHNFYLGYKNKAMTQLLLTVLSFGILSFVSAIWGFIEGVLILIGNINVDANGNPLSE